MSIDWDKWASNLLEEIYYTPENLRVALVKEHLLKAELRGKNEWIETQEEFPQRPLNFRKGPY